MICPNANQYGGPKNQFERSIDSGLPMRKRAVQILHYSQGRPELSGKVRSVRISVLDLPRPAEHSRAVDRALFARRDKVIEMGAVPSPSFPPPSGHFQVRPTGVFSAARWWHFRGRTWRLVLRRPDMLRSNGSFNR